YTYEYDSPIVPTVYYGCKTMEPLVLFSGIVPRKSLNQLVFQIYGFLTDLVGRGDDARAGGVSPLKDYELCKLLRDVDIRALDRAADDRSPAARVGQSDHGGSGLAAAPEVIAANRYQRSGIANRGQGQTGDFLLRAVGILR